MTDISKKGKTSKKVTVSKEAIEALPVRDMSDLFDLTGKVAVVTGGAQGIGRAAACVLAAQGAGAVIIFDLESQRVAAEAAVIEAAEGDDASEYDSEW